MGEFKISKKNHVLVGIYSFIFYLVLTASRGEFFVWQSGEILLAIIGALLTTIASAKILKEIDDYGFLLNPIRVFLLIIYLFPFLFRVTVANLDVAYRIISGKTNPGIVKIDPELEKDTSLTLLANSITLTPGTLTVDEKDGKLYIHWINVKEDYQIEDICGSFPKWARRIAE